MLYIGQVSMTTRFPFSFFKNNFPYKRNFGAGFGLNSLAFTLGLAGFMWQLEVHRISVSEEILEIGYSNFILWMRAPRTRHVEGLALSWVIGGDVAVFLPTRLWTSRGQMLTFTYLYTPCDTLCRGSYAVGNQYIFLNIVKYNT